MTGVHLLLGAAVGAAALLLLAAGAGHLRHPRAFAAVLDAQRTLPAGVRRLVARVLGPVELALGAALLAGLMLSGAPLRLAAAVVAALYLGLGGYVALVWRTRPRVPCGCFGSSAPASGWTVLRALALGVACAVAAVVGMPPATGLPGVAVAGGALVLAGACWLLPELASP